jgi:hypothetical protein
MPRVKKLNDELGMNEDRTVVVKKEIVNVPEIPEVSVTSLQTKVKRELSEAQKANLQRLIEANKKKWEDKRKLSNEAAEKAISQKKEDEEKKLASGEYVRVKVKEKRQYRKQDSKANEQSTTPTTSEVESSTTETETETEDEEIPATYKSKKRAVRREVKKTLKTLKQIDEAIETAPQGNPYMAYLQGRWK